MATMTTANATASDCCGRRGKNIRSWAAAAYAAINNSNTIAARPVAPKPLLDAKGDGEGKPFVFGARRAPLRSPAQQLTPPRLTPVGLGRRGQDTPPLNRPSTAERSNCQEKPFAYSPEPPSVHQPQVHPGGRGPRPAATIWATASHTRREC